MTSTTLEGRVTDALYATTFEGPSVEEVARRRLAESCDYAFCFNQVTLTHSNGILTLQGRLPSFYLKQMLQTLLRNLDGVTRIDNRVDVVSATGLSSVRPR